MYQVSQYFMGVLFNLHNRPIWGKLTSLMSQKRTARPKEVKSMSLWFKLKNYRGVPFVVQRKRIQLLSMRTWVWSLASVGQGSSVAVSCGVGFRHGWIPSCCGCGVDRQLQLWFDPSLGTSICCGCSPKKTPPPKIVAPDTRVLGNFSSTIWLS